ncbi:MAG: ABC transporter permease subunit, partial [Betaproteobacteria bacterium]
SGIIIGLSRSQILIKEIIPNILPLLITLLSLEMGIAIVVEAILSFVGLSSSGVPTWGGIIQEGRLYVYQAWWVMALPVMCIVAAVLSINAFGDELRRSIDPIR